MFSHLRRLGLAAIVSLSSVSAVADDVIATAADSGKTVSVHVGQGLTVNLTGTKGSGKYWRLNSDLTPELTLSGRSAQSGVLPGSTETTSYSFKTNSPGRLEFKASYMATGAPIPKTNDVEFTIDVLR